MSVLKTRVVLIFVYVLPSREMTREAEFLSDFGHSELRRPQLSPPTPSSMLGLLACRADMWSSAVAPSVGQRLKFGKWKDVWELRGFSSLLFASGPKPAFLGFFK